MPEPHSAVRSNQPAGLASIGGGQSPLSLKQLLVDSLLLYKKHFWTFTRPLLAPTLLATAGFYAFTILMSAYTQYVATHPEIQEFYFVPAMIVLLLITAATGGVIYLGLWQYMVYTVTLNVNAREALEDWPLNVPGAYRKMDWPTKVSYKILLSAFMIAIGLDLPILMLTLVPCVILALAAQAVGGDNFSNTVLNISGNVAMLFGIIPLYLLTFISQIVAFEHIPRNPMPTLLKSCRMFWQAPWRTIALQTVLLILTCYLVPLILVMPLRLLHLTFPLDGLHQWLIHLMLTGFDPAANRELGTLLRQVHEMLPAYVPEPQALFSQWQTAVPGMAGFVTDQLLMTLIITLILPWGTIAFAMLYRDILGHWGDEPSP